MAGSIAKAYVQVIPSAEGIKGKLSGVFGKEMPSAGQSAGGIFGSNLIGKIKGVIAAAGIGKMFAEAIQAGGAMEQSLGGIETLFKDSADTVKKNAEQAYRTAGMSANQYMESVTSFSASLLQGLGGDTAKAAKIADMAMTDMSDNANKMGTDMQSIQNAYQGFAKQNYTMLDNLKLGYGGTKTEMERLLKDAEKLSGVKYDISNLSDVYSAIHVIQEEMDITGTTAKEASSTLQGSFASMKAAASDLLANLALGRDIGPSLKALSQTVFTYLGNLMPAIGQILKGIPDILVEALNMAVKGLNIVGANAGVIAEEGVAIVVKLVEAIVSALPYLAASAWNILAALGQAILSIDWAQLGSDMMARLKESMDIAAGEIFGTDGNLIESVLGAIRTGLPKLLEAGETIVNGIAEGITTYGPVVLENGMSLLTDLEAILSENMPRMISQGESFVMTLLDGIIAAAPGLIKSATDLVTNFVVNLISNLPQVLNSGKNILLKLIEGIRVIFPQLLSSAGDAIGKLLSGIASNLPQILEAGFGLVSELIMGIGEALPDIAAAAGTLIGKVWDAIKNIDWIQLGKDIINGLIKGLGQMGNALWEAAKSVAKSALNSIKKALGIASPSKVMAAEVGRFIPPGVAVGAKANTKPLTDAMDYLADMTTDTLKADLDVSHDMIKMTGPAVNQSSKVARGTDGGNGAILDVLEEIVARNTQTQNAAIELLRDILEAVLGIHIGDGDVFEAVERYKRKQSVATGGAGW